MFQRSPVTLTLILICVAVYILQMMNPNLTSQFGLYAGSLSAQGFYRIVTCAFLHGSLEHIFVNMVSLYNIGSYVEEYMGSKKYIIVVLVSLLTSGLAVVFLSPPRTLTVGFSGVIFGLFGAFISIMIITGAIHNRSVYSMVMRMLIPNIIISIMPGVSWQGHLGGFIGGMASGWLANSPKRIQN